jgi:lysophospholipase L1-like esterase
MKHLRILLLVLLTLSLIPGLAIAAKPVDGGGGKPGGGGSSSLTYVALGDSIAWGMGADNDYGYVHRYRDILAATQSVDLKNYAMKGIKTSDLLFQLNVDMKVRRALKGASLITISIGGNNLLSCASDNYSSIDATCAQTGVDQFISDWDDIVNEIRSLNSTASIKVMTLYNPYKDDANDLNEKALFDTADGFVKQINDEINRLTILNYTVVDVYTAFSGVDETGAFKVCKYTHFCETTRDPHPTNEGHQLIADLHK